MKNTRNCRICMFYELDTADEDIPDGPEFGECRRYPPSSSTGDPLDVTSVFGDFVLVNGRDWCGEFKPNKFFV